ncbi:MAG: tyrosine-type recombinase/integrase [Gammaproteobacteria bacterium]|nr:tyrosine-type recombinase/integrase [Gammaproteobacteria bacterium]
MLTDTAIRNTKPSMKPMKLFDGGGLYLLITPEGGRWWRLKYRYGGKEKLLSLGTYPEVPLAGRKEKKTGVWIEGARDRRDAARQLLANGVDPGAQRKAARAAAADAAANSFEALAREWHAHRAKALEATTLEGIMMRMEKHLFPWLGSRPISEIEPPELLRVLQRAEAKELGETPRRLRQYCGQIFRFAIATGRAARDPAADLKGALRPHKVRHHAAVVDPKAVGELLRAIDGYKGEPTTRAALRLAPLVFVRPGELRQAEWSEFDLDAGEWRIPASRMKMRDAHLVPLSKQAVEILRELKTLTGRWTYVFPSIRSKSRPMSSNTINAALRRLGYTNTDATAHGFRSTACSILNEQGWHRDAIERQLAHAERDGVRAAYNRAEHLPERRKMMQAWADYLDALRDGAKVIPIAKKA